MYKKNPILEQKYFDKRIIETFLITEEPII